MAKAKTHGGVRAKAGRKEVTDKKINVTTYHRQSDVDLLGGLPIVRKVIISTLENKLKIIKKT